MLKVNVAPLINVLDGQEIVNEFLRMTTVYIIKRLKINY
jgi:hypothetical protein